MIKLKTKYFKYQSINIFEIKKINYDRLIYLRVKEENVLLKVLIAFFVQRKSIS